MKTTLAYQHPTRAVVDLGALRMNLDAVRSYVGPQVKIAAVVKADAYGHGMQRVAEEALRWGVSHLAVARVFEGVQLRLAGITAPIVVFELPPAGHELPAIENDLEVTVATEGGIGRLEAASSSLGRNARVHVKVDTGMGRMGVPTEQAAAFIKRVAQSRHCDLAGVYSHFATSEDPDQHFALEQLSRFNAVLEDLQGVQVPLRHMANSGAIMTLPGSHFDMVRPGIMLYGYPPGVQMRVKHPLVPVMSLLSRIAFLKTVGPGVSISYGRKYFTSRKTIIATIPVGYADGFARLLTGKGEVLIRGGRYPVVGSVSMDQIMVDLGPDSPAEEGDDVVLIGRSGDDSITALDISQKIGTIPYEVTCLITQRVARLYVDHRA